MTIFLLEDDPGRVERMRDRLKERFFTYDVSVSGTSHEFIRSLESGFERRSAALICLDHDLPIDRDDHGRVVDAGSGRDVSRFLARREPVCPVVIHSTNVAAAEAMASDLKPAGWSVERVMPYGDLEWVDEAWFPVVRKAVLSCATRVAATAPAG